MGDVMEAELHVRFILNGAPTEVRVRPETTLLTLLRDHLLLTGTKCGCEIGQCGACTVILDGQAVASCLVMAGQVEGSRVETVEGLATGEDPSGRGLHALQKAFLDRDAVACGFCTPGMLMAAKALLDRNPSPSREEIRVAISGNLCRCTGYIPIVDAIEQAAAAPKGGPA
jgi:carbon-monoxide dehydrogenase small subunit